VGGFRYFIFSFARENNTNFQECYFVAPDVYFLLELTCANVGRGFLNFESSESNNRCQLVFSRKNIIENKKFNMLKILLK
jgi:hypothetical protein